MLTRFNRGAVFMGLFAAVGHNPRRLIRKLSDNPLSMKFIVAVAPGIGPEWRKIMQRSRKGPRTRAPRGLSQPYQAPSSNMVQCASFSLMHRVGHISHMPSCASHAFKIASSILLTSLSPIFGKYDCTISYEKHTFSILPDSFCKMLSFAFFAI